MSNSLFENFRIFTGKTESDFFEGALWVSGGTIKKVYKRSDTLPSVSWDHRIDGQGKFLLPGLINAHTHIYSTFATGLSVHPFNPATFSLLLEQLWWKIDRSLKEEDVYWSARAAAVQLIDHGVTTIIDHHSGPFCLKGVGDVLSRAIIQESGLRGVFSVETSDRDGKEIRQQEIEENLSIFEKKRKYPGKMGALFGLHASFTLEDETLAEIGRYGLPIHAHVGEGEEDGVKHVVRYLCSPLQRFQRYGLCKPDSLVVHGIRLKEEDFPLLLENRCTIAVNPQSNQNNGAGISDCSRFKNHSIPVVLGNDGYGFDFSRDIRLLLLSQHLLHRSPTAFSLHDAYEVVFNNSATYLSKLLGEQIGVIDEGAAADFITYDYIPWTPLFPGNFFGHWFFGILESGKPRDVIVNGIFLKKEGAIVLPIAEILSESQKVAERLWKRIE
jgi:cytosine/adenosine deaminase-related metal-dependent hydrolase